MPVLAQSCPGHPTARLHWGAAVSALASVSLPSSLSLGLAAAMDLLQAEYERLARASTYTDSYESRRLAPLRLLLHQALKSKAQKMVQLAGNTPLLVSFSSDPSSLLLASTTKSSSSAGTVVRQGRVLVELLLQRTAYKHFQEDGLAVLHIVPGPPLPLTQGKAATNLFQAACKMNPLVRQWGHEGIVIHHIVCDRAVHSALESLLYGRLQAYYSDIYGPDLGARKGLWQMQELFCGTPCAAHASQNAIQWSLGPMSQGEVFHDLHIVIESLRNSFSFLREHIWDFLFTNVRFRPGPHDLDTARALWSALGVESDALHLLTEVHPVWDGAYLWVGAALEQNSNFLALVSHAILYLCRWRKFTESRFTSLGTATRSLVASMVAGLAEIVRKTRAAPHVSDYHLHGFAKLTPSVCRASIVIALSTWPAESFLYELLDDDRLARRPQELWTTVTDEISYLVDLPQELWSTLAAIISNDHTGHALRSDVVFAATTSAGFLHHHVFAAFDSLPWSLTKMDEDVLWPFLEGLDPAECDDALASNLSRLATSGYPKDKILEALKLLKEVSWSSTGVEQQHGSCATVRRLHPDIGVEALSLRAFLHACRHFFHTQDSAHVGPADAQPSVPRSVTQAPRQRHAERITGRHVFVSELFKEVRQQLPGGMRQKMSWQERKELMGRSTDLYESLSPAERLQYDRRALAHAQELRAGQAEQDLAQGQLLALYQQRAAEELASNGLRNILSNGPLDAEDWAGMLEQNDAPEMQPTAALQTWRQMQEAPIAPNATQLDIFYQYEIPKPPKPDRAAWVPAVCQHRDIFRHTIFMRGLHAKAPAFLLMYAKQSPKEVCFLRLSRADAAPLVCDPGQGLTAPDHPPMSFKWREDLKFVRGSLDVFPVDSEIYILRDPWLSQGDLISSYMAPEPLTMMLAELPAVKQKSKEPKEPKAKKVKVSDISPELLLEHPFLSDIIGEEVRRTRRCRDNAPAAASSGDPAARPHRVPVSDLTEDQMASAWDSLRVRREAWALQVEEAHDHFPVVMRGGAWTQANRRTPADCFASSASKGEPTSWCRRYGLPKMASFSILKYGNEMASKLAEEWSRKMHYYFDLYISANNPDFLYEPGHITSYTPPQAWVEWKNSLLQTDKAMPRAMEVERLQPVNPAPAGPAH